MSPAMKFTIGLAAAMLTGGTWHGPFGQGEILIDRLEREAAAAVAASEVPGIRVSLARRPLARAVTLDGPANDLQREGLGDQKGISDYVRDIDGIARVRWADEANAGGGGLPLIAETLLLLAFAYLVGLGIGRLFWGRPEKHGYL